MLIEFTVENFRSIHQPVTLSMVAASRLQKRGNVVPAGILDEKSFPPLLKAAAVYGPNASGKSTLMLAFRALFDMVERSPSADLRKLPAAPFRFDKDARSRPSRFEINFIHEGIRFGYELAISAERVHREVLTRYRRGKGCKLYDRRLMDGQEVYEFGEQLEGGHALANVWRSLTGPQTLFLAQAVANSSAELTQLRVPFSWLRRMYVSGIGGMQAMAHMSQHMIAQSSKFAEFVTGFLSDVDVPVTDISAKPVVAGSASHDLTDLDPKTRRDRFAQISSLDVETTLTHRTALGTAKFDFEEESSGTQNLLGFAFPWLVFGEHLHPDAFDFCFIDEFDSSLHPKVVAELVRRHIERAHPTQLVFTTHDTHLMDAKLLRRDQFWLTERDETGATQLRCVHDFEGREGEDIEKRYYEGRYRSLPFIRGQ